MACKLESEGRVIRIQWIDVHFDKISLTENYKYVWSDIYAYYRNFPIAFTSP